MSRKNFIIALVAVFGVAIIAFVVLNLFVFNNQEELIEQEPIDTSYELTMEDKEEIDSLLKEAIPVITTIGLQFHEDSSDEEKASIVEKVRTNTESGEGDEHYISRPASILNSYPYLSTKSDYIRSTADLSKAYIFSDFSNLRTYQTEISGISIPNEGYYESSTIHVEVPLNFVSDGITRTIGSPPVNHDEYGIFVPYNIVTESSIAESHSAIFVLEKMDDNSPWRILEIKDFEQPAFFSLLNNNQDDIDKIFAEALFTHEYNIVYTERDLLHDHEH